MANDHINEQLAKAVRSNNLEQIKALLSAGASPDYRPHNRWPNERDTLLHMTNSAEITKELLSRGAKVNAVNEYRETPLHYAITKSKKVELIRELLKHGAYVNAQNRRGNTALNDAVRKSGVPVAVIKELLEYGADITLRNREQRCFWKNASSFENSIGRPKYATLLIKFTVLRHFHNDYKKIINLAAYDDCSNYKVLSSYLDDCVHEILHMEADKTENGFSLYKFVTNNIKTEDPQCKEFAMQLFMGQTNIDYSVQYPIYQDFILDRIKLHSDRKDLINKLSQIQFYTKVDIVGQNSEQKTIVLNYYTTYYITKYLSDDDLFNFIVAFDNSNQCAIQSSSTVSCETSASSNAKHVKLE